MGIKNNKKLRNHLDILCNDEQDCQTKSLHFIGYVNKLIINFVHFTWPCVKQII